MVIIVVVIQMFAMLSVVFVYASRYKKVAPDQAMVVYGRQMSPGSSIGYRVISGGGKFILPIIEGIEVMDLGAKDIVMDLDNIRTDTVGGSIPIRMKLTVLYKVSSERSVLKAAAENLMGKTAEEIKRMVEVVVEGEARTVTSTMTPEAVDKNRDQVARNIEVMASQQLMELGLEIRGLAIIRVHIKGVD
jgi:flotillin